jgi:hypothetical protein
MAIAKIYEFPRIVFLVWGKGGLGESKFKLLALFPLVKLLHNLLHTLLQRTPRNVPEHTGRLTNIQQNALQTEVRLYSRKKNAKTGKRPNLGTFSSRAAAEKHERAVQFFKKR